MLEFDPSWRFDSPGELPADARLAFVNLIPQIVSQGNRRELLEHFKRRFAGPAGRTYSSSSNESWAESDLDSYMRDASQNAPLFIDAFFTACEELHAKGIGVPAVERLNRILRESNSGYEIDPPELLARTPHVKVTLPEQAPSLNEKAQALFRQSVEVSDKMLSEGHGRQAVQELLWLLESVMTSFKGLDAGTGTVKSDYFNEIVNELRSYNRGKTIEQVVGWMTQMHGFLSSPTGGGIRHGADLNSIAVTDLSEANLFCNLIRSYIAYLLAEHERLTL